jgi:formylglycine-generating enzyme required for sulfatase activity
MPKGRLRWCGCLALGALACASNERAGGAAAHPASATRAPLEPFREKIPGTAVEFDMVAIPAGEIAIADGRQPNGNDPNTKKTVAVGPFWIGKTELTFDAFDLYVYSLDEPDPTHPVLVDGVTRPTKPYHPPDRGFGKEGFAAISLSYKNATEFCVWLSKKTGKRYRLPTEAEWQWACRAGTKTNYFFGDDPAPLEDYAWFREDSDFAPHPVATKKPNAWGLHDTLGNVVEWCVGLDGAPVACGGSFRDPAEKLRCDSRVRQDKSWNATDPNIPKSQWWLTDGPFVGFRVVCEPAAN